MATDNFWGKFRRWRRHRPFWGGLLLMLSAVELFLSANMAIGGIEIHLGPQGFLTYLLPLIMLICGLLSWFTPQQRLFYGIVSLLTALYSFIGLNLGGFFIGMLLGLFGGALVISWGPPRSKPGTPLAGPPTDEPSDHHQDQPVDVGDDIFDEHQDIDETQRIDIAGHDDRPHDQQHVRPAGFVIPRQAARGSGLERLGRNRKAVALGIVPVAVTATILMVGSNLPASAEDCPEGLPSRSTSATTATTSSTTSSAAAAAVAAAKKKATSAAVAAKSSSVSSTKKAAAASSATATAEDEGSGNAILDGIESVVDGVSNLLGIGEESSSPSASPSPSESESTEPTETADPEPSASSSSPSASSSSSSDATSAPTETTSASVQPTASGDDIPCLGARVYGKVASADDIPTVAKKPGLMEVDLLTMYNSTYDGVVDMPTAGGGSYRALKFTMTKAVNKPFKLTIDEAGDAQTVITSKELTTDGTVKFYTSEFRGNLFGLIPVVFTPDSPPPLTLPVLWFTDAKIQLSYVRCDTLTGDPLKVAGI